MSNKINFSNLKREKIKCLIFENEKKEVKVIYDNFKNVKVENPIEIYNPSKEQKGKIMEILSKSVNKETGKVNISGESIIKNFLPILTNIFLEVDDNTLKEIIDDPSDILLCVQDEIGKIINNLVNRFKNNMEVFKNLSSNERKLLINKIKEENKKSDKEELTQEEIQVIEKAKKLGKI